MPLLSLLSLAAFIYLKSSGAIVTLYFAWVTPTHTEYKLINILLFYLLKQHPAMRTKEKNDLPTYDF